MERREPAQRRDDTRLREAGKEAEARERCTEKEGRESERVRE